MSKASTSLINITQACGEIRQACAEAETEGACSPFVLVVGAGISNPYVPLAADIIEHCKTRARETGRFQQPSSLDPLAVYVHWLDRAYPQPQRRRRYLASLLKDKPVSQANFRLAHLLLREDSEQLAITDLVLSVNFDDSLERALRIFGQPFVSCDHPQSAASIDPTDEALKLIHVYGTHAHYDCANLGEAATRRTGTATTGTPDGSMHLLLESILRERSPIVVGYAGWERDLVMSSMRKRLKGVRLETNLYWFCHRLEDFESLPQWLKEHVNVRFVLPQASLPEDEFELDDGDMDDAAADYRTATESTGSSSNTLPARAIFEALIQEFDLPEPALTQDPLAHLTQRLRELLPESLRNDPYELNNVLARLESGVRDTPVVPAPDKPPTKHSESLPMLALETMRQAVRRAQWAAALAEGKSIPADSLASEQREQLADLFLKTAMGLFEEQPQRLAAFDAVIDLDCPALRSNAAFNVYLGKAYLYKGRTLGNINRAADEIAIYEQALERFRDLEVQGLRDQLVRAIAQRLSDYGTVDANRIAEGLTRKFGEHALPGLRRALTIALGEKNRIQGALRPLPVMTTPDTIAMPAVDSSEEQRAATPPAVEPQKAPTHDEKVAMATSDKAFEWLMHAKEQWILGNEAGARHALANASNAVNVSLKRCPDRPITLGNLAYIQFLNNQREAARVTLTKAISLGGEGLRVRILKDTNFHDLPHDKAYRWLIESIHPMKPESRIPPQRATIPPPAPSAPVRSGQAPAAVRSR